MAVKGYAGGTGGVTQLVAGTGIGLNPSGGTGTVTVNATGGSAQTITSGITAAGTNLATATQLTSQQNIVNTVAAGTGVALPLTPATGFVATVKNYGANTLLVYPNTALVKIGNSAAGAGISLGALASVTLAFDGTQWW